LSWARVALEDLDRRPAAEAALEFGGDSLDETVRRAGLEQRDDTAAETGAGQARAEDAFAGRRARHELIELGHRDLEQRAQRLVRLEHLPPEAGRVAALERFPRREGTRDLLHHVGGAPGEHRLELVPVLLEDLDADVAQAGGSGLVPTQTLERRGALANAFVERSLRELAPHHRIGDADRVARGVERDVGARAVL